MPRAMKPVSKQSRAGSIMKEPSHANGHGVRVWRLAGAPRNRCLVQCDDHLRQSRGGVRGIEWADQPARVDEERKGPGASAIRRVLTGIPDRPRLEASEIAQGRACRCEIAMRALDPRIQLL